MERRTSPIETLSEEHQARFIFFEKRKNELYQRAVEAHAIALYMLSENYEDDFYIEVKNKFRAIQITTREQATPMISAAEFSCETAFGVIHDSDVDAIGLLLAMKQYVLEEDTQSFETMNQIMTIIGNKVGQNKFNEINKKVNYVLTRLEYMKEKGLI